MADEATAEAPNFAITLQSIKEASEDEVFDFMDEFAVENDATEKPVDPEDPSESLDTSGDTIEEDLPSSLPNSQEMDEMVKQATSNNTHRSTSWGLKKFTDWCFKRTRTVDLHTITAENVNIELRKFYADVKGQNNKTLTPSALTGIRAAIQRSLINPPYSRPLNIIGDREFLSANQMFTTRCKLYYKSGHSKPKHKPAIGSGDMVKLNDYFRNYTQSPTVLLEYTWFVLCFYFGRRGREGWRDFKHDSFEVKSDDKGREYVCYTKTEQTKNHQGGHQQNQQDYSDQRMYETSTTLNPVNAYKFYIDKRNKECDAFFQTPLVHFALDQQCWFKKSPMGKNTLSTVMQRVSKKAGLSQIYTCHSVRASTVTTLGHAGVQPRLICGITKHRNEASLKHYVEEMSNDQKYACTKVLSNALEPATSANQPPAIEQPQPPQNDPDQDEPGSASNAVTAQQLPDGSLAITIPTNTEPPPMVQQPLQPNQMWPVSAPLKQQGELKCLQNLLPSCSFDHCTININTMGQAQSTN